ncbi:MAG: precorrin-3B C(17)-methyltransferase [Chloroflexi bacterium AL-W]|nr:bifunctional precorrin-2 dehydrogenase/sirohydrochlorin ferrochelatase [Blastochloris sp.]NOK64271.1 precorrin-3B C(17)-methyltransferase [Chloroflexi bacterium AL-N1]NOK71516.1 precorrin-3B C(17)-methyltransferase [Chloroflexi bacterium AL-N10]NOK78862.1 precorrin-3B C(17)-methyltransferase [Chloroflexi bacterium AL-N5]NOK86338.1 precorrin-3B C(17)-methyltransferase [Chloroflexi bacterium AL-W]NOK93307.1 precorrin-3B C(17)-methyltransferase [Chloroflexi bacterium AL-N15]
MSQQFTYPITLTQRIFAIVIGGGRVAERKVQGLLAAGALVYLISPAITRALQQLVKEEHLTWEKRVYQPGDLDQDTPEGLYLVFAATNRREVNAQVALDAAHCGLLCNVVDNPAEGTFHVPAVYRNDEMTIAVSTAGRNPTRAKQARDWIVAYLAREDEV